LKNPNFSIIFRYYLVLFNILAASLTQSLDQIMHPNPLIRANLYFEILSFVCGIFIFVVGSFRIWIYHKIILKLNLKGKEKFLQKLLNSPKKKQVFKDEMDSEAYEIFTHKSDIKSFNFSTNN